jgi:hypothetical protein
VIAVEVLGSSEPSAEAHNGGESGLSLHRRRLFVGFRLPRRAVTARLRSFPRDAQFLPPSPQGIANSLVQSGAEFMRCYFLRGGRIAGVEILPLGLSDEDAIARAHTLSSKRKGPFDGFEVWDGARFIFRRPRRPTRLRPASRGRHRRMKADRNAPGVRYDAASASRRMTSL